jgi:hypothetical protein
VLIDSITRLMVAVHKHGLVLRCSRAQQAP